MHLQFPGYPTNGRSYQVWLLYLLYCHVLTTRGKINTLNWTRKRQPITRRKLAYEVAKRLEQYLFDMAVRSYRDWFNFRVPHQYNVEICSGWIG